MQSLPALNLRCICGRSDWLAAAPGTEAESVAGIVVAREVPVVCWCEVCWWEKFSRAP